MQKILKEKQTQKKEIGTYKDKIGYALIQNNKYKLVWLEIKQ